MIRTNHIFNKLKFFLEYIPKSEYSIFATDYQKLEYEDFDLLADWRITKSNFSIFNTTIASTCEVKIVNIPVYITNLAYIFNNKKLKYKNNFYYYKDLVFRLIGQVADKKIVFFTGVVTDYKTDTNFIYLTLESRILDLTKQSGDLLKDNFGGWYRNLRFSDALQVLLQDTEIQYSGDIRDIEIKNAFGDTGDYAVNSFNIYNLFQIYYVFAPIENATRQTVGAKIKGGKFVFYTTNRTLLFGDTTFPFYFEGYLADYGTSQGQEVYNGYLTAKYQNKNKYLRANPSLTEFNTKYSYAAKQGFLPYKENGEVLGIYLKALDYYFDKNAGVYASTTDQSFDPSSIGYAYIPFMSLQKWGNYFAADYYAQDYMPKNSEIGLTTYYFNGDGTVNFKFAQNVEQMASYVRSFFGSITKSVNDYQGFLEQRATNKTLFARSFGYAQELYSDIFFVYYRTKNSYTRTPEYEVEPRIYKNYAEKTFEIVLATSDGVEDVIMETDYLPRDFYFYSDDTGTQKLYILLENPFKVYISDDIGVYLYEYDINTGTLALIKDFSNDSNKLFAAAAYLGYFDYIKNEHVFVINGGDGFLFLQNSGTTYTRFLPSGYSVPTAVLRLDDSNLLFFCKNTTQETLAIGYIDNNRNISIIADYETEKMIGVYKGGYLVKAYAGEIYGYFNNNLITRYPAARISLLDASKYNKLQVLLELAKMGVKVVNIDGNDNLYFLDFRDVSTNNEAIEISGDMRPEDEIKQIGKEEIKRIIVKAFGINYKDVYSWSLRKGNYAGDIALNVENYKDVNCNILLQVTAANQIRYKIIADNDLDMTSFVTQSVSGFDNIIISQQGINFYVKFSSTPAIGSEFLLNIGNQSLQEVNITYTQVIDTAETEDTKDIAIRYLTGDLAKNYSETMKAVYLKPRRIFEISINIPIYLQEDFTFVKNLLFYKTGNNFFFYNEVTKIFLIMDIEINSNGSVKMKVLEV